MRIPYILDMGSGDPADEPQEIEIMATYRAAYFNDMAMTTPEQSDLSEEALIEAAVAEAHKGNILGDSHPYVTEEDFRAGLEVGDFTDRYA